MLLPIVYNAMALKEQLRGLPLFRALQGAICASAYDCLLRHPPPDPTTPDKQAGCGWHPSDLSPVASLLDRVCVFCSTEDTNGLGLRCGGCDDFDG